MNPKTIKRKADEKFSNQWIRLIAPDLLLNLKITKSSKNETLSASFDLM